MCAHSSHADLETGHACLDRAIEALDHQPQPLSLDVLRCAVRQTRRLTARLAILAEALAGRADTDLRDAGLLDSRADAGPPDQTVREIAQDLRTMARHLTGARLLLEPAEDDLTHLTAPH